jgi:hypothetical protein
LGENHVEHVPRRQTAVASQVHAIQLVRGFCLGQHGAADRILVTGDVAYSGKTDEYENASECLEQLASASGCEVTLTGLTFCTTVTERVYITTSGCEIEPDGIRGL